jgi:hypothetical protein
MMDSQNHRERWRETIAGCESCARAQFWMRSNPVRAFTNLGSARTALG